MVGSQNKRNKSDNLHIIQISKNSFGVYQFKINDEFSNLVGLRKSGSDPRASKSGFNDRWINYSAWSTVSW
jgi:hypothetical protein